MSTEAVQEGEHEEPTDDTDLRRFVCGVEGCSKRFKKNGNLKQHEANAHNIGVVWHCCDVEGCSKRFKEKGTLKQHEADAHDIGVVWHCCDVEGCSERFKQKGNLKRHIQLMHNDVYVARKKQEEERVRLALVAAGWSEWFGSAGLPPVGFFKREKQINFECAGVQSNTKYCRIDFAISTAGGLVFLEVDEDQHQYGYDGHVSCDMKRMSHVMESMMVELGDAMPYIYWLRYNPSAWHVDGKLVRCVKTEREARLVRWLDTFEATCPVAIGYACYDTEDNTMDVLSNEEYNPHYLEIAVDLGALD